MTSILSSDVKNGDGSRVAKCLNEICFATYKNTIFITVRDGIHVLFKTKYTHILAHLSQRLMGELIAYQ